MSDSDVFASLLLEESKRFLEKAAATESAQGQTAYLHAALVIGMGAFEAHINAIAEEMLLVNGLTVPERSILEERDFSLSKGRFEITKKLKIYRIEDRLEFVYRRFSGKQLNHRPVWRSQLAEALELRNQLLHPRQNTNLDIQSVSRALRSVLAALDEIYRGIYKRPYPAVGRDLDSHLDF